MPFETLIFIYTYLCIYILKDNPKDQYIFAYSYKQSLEITEQVSICYRKQVVIKNKLLCNNTNFSSASVSTHATRITCSELNRSCYNIVFSQLL